VHGRQINTLYNPLVGANIISSDLAIEFLGDEPLSPSRTSVMDPHGKILEGIGILI
jgi:hypothetical protein